MVDKITTATKSKYMQNLELAEIKAIVFDLDGTLYNEADFVKSGFEAVSKFISTSYFLDYKLVNTILIHDFNSGVRNNNFNVLLDKINIKDITVSDLVEIYRTHKPNIHLYPDAEVILRSLKGHFKLGLITDGWELTQNNKISALDINKYFDSVIITDVLGKKHRKPDEKPFKMILDNLGIIANKTVYIGDNPLKDFVSAKRLGFFTIRVRRGDGEYDCIDVDAEHEADHIVDNLLHLKKLINKVAHESK